MPRQDRERSRRMLQNTLVRCGFTQQESDEWLARFSGENLTARDVSRIDDLLCAVCMKFEAGRAEFETEERRLREALVVLEREQQKFIANIRKLADETDSRLRFDALLQQMEEVDMTGLAELEDPT